MSLPAVLRYLPARLRPLQNPVVWMPALALTFIGIFAWEYKNHPEWLQWNGVDSETALETGLTPEEQAGIAEIDTLDLLINEANSNSPSPEAINPSAISPETASGTEESSAQPTAQAPSQEQAQPFANYLAQYQLPGGRVNGANTAVQGSSASSSPLSAASGTGAPTNDLFLLSQPTPASQESALSRALSDRAAARTAQPVDSPQSSQARPSLSDSAESVAAENPATDLPLNQSGVIRGQLPGSPDVNFIRTTPDMSPPPGTTGYQPPASIDLSTYDRTLNRTGQFTPGVPSATAPSPSFELRQPQRGAGVLPGEVNTGITQPQTQVPGVSSGAVTPQPEPSNAFDDFFD
ncbi:MAG: hypothetical protein AAFV72_19415 [Cyanobacteria bacterium J06635_1]